MAINLRDFLKESNAIEGIHREVTADDVNTAQFFLDLLLPDIKGLECLLAAFQPGAKLRDRKGLNVRVGNHIAPYGGPEIRQHLTEILQRAEGADPYWLHHDYETLHPFTDGNGRTGRMLWLWGMYKRVPRVPPLGFLHTWYYQSLDRGRKRDVA